MIVRSICLVLLLSASSARSQEIVSVEEVQPHTRLFVKQPNGAMTVMPPEHLIMPSGMYSHESLQFLTNPKLLENATLSDTQKTQLEELRKGYQKESEKLAEKFKTAIGNAKDKTEKLELAKELFADIKALQTRAANKIEVELIPFQASMIKKHKFKQLSYLGFCRTILRDPFATDLKMNKEQKQAIQKIADETDKEITELVAKAREKAKKKAMKILDKEQQKYLENFGDPNQ